MRTRTSPSKMESSSPVIFTCCIRFHVLSEKDKVYLSRVASDKSELLKETFTSLLGRLSNFIDIVAVLRSPSDSESIQLALLTFLYKPCTLYPYASVSVKPVQLDKQSTPPEVLIEPTVPSEVVSLIYEI